jgi:YHS domain-containing protein
MVITMFRLLWLFLIGYLVFILMRSLTGLASRKSGPAGSSGAGPSSGEELVKDPQCGAYFPKSEGVSAVIAGEQFHFCSPACRDEFLRNK